MLAPPIGKFLKQYKFCERVCIVRTCLDMNSRISCNVFHRKNAVIAKRWGGRKGQKFYIDQHFETLIHTLNDWQDYLLLADILVREQDRHSSYPRPQDNYRLKLINRCLNLYFPTLYKLYHGIYIRTSTHFQCSIKQLARLPPMVFQWLSVLPKWSPDDMNLSQLV